MIKNTQCRIKRSEIATPGALPNLIEKSIDRDTLRWYIAQVTHDSLVVETTAAPRAGNQLEPPAALRHYPGKQVILSTIPTGIGCSIGGYAGDAGPVTNLLALAADYLITNPNAVNASGFIGLNQSNVIYTDGCSIDMFRKGHVDLNIPYSNRIGLVVEKCDESKLDVIFNIVNAVRAVHGVDIADVVITDRAIGGRCIENQSGAFAGTIDSPEVLLDACEKLINKGATALAVTTNIQDLPLDGYARHFDGRYPNPVGGVEAVISYLITSTFRMPSAHAPLLNIKQLDLTHPVVDARGAGEMSSESGLACILMGLRRAPQIGPNSRCRIKDTVNVNNLIAVVSPASSLGGIPAVDAQKHEIPIIAVAENETILEVSQASLGLHNVVEVRSYAEAAGVILALKNGINLETLSRPLATFRHN